MLDEEHEVARPATVTEPREASDESRSHCPDDEAADDRPLHRGSDSNRPTSSDETPIEAARQRARQSTAMNNSAASATGTTFAAARTPAVAPLALPVAVSVARRPQHPGLRDDGPGYRPTDVGTALRFADQHRGRLQYVPAWGWLEWDGRRWRRDETDAVALAAGRDTLAHIYAELAVGIAAGAPDAALLKYATGLANGSALQRVIDHARTETGIVAAPAAFDRDRYALVVENGTLDLRTGALRQHNPADQITRLAAVAYDPAATAPKWNAFLARVLPEPDVRTWVQRYFGYALTGDVREQCLAFFVGEGQNGKSVLLDVILALLGEYAFRAAPDLVLASHTERHPTEIADLAGRRLVVCSEIEQGRAWAEATIKRLTGDATITARRMRRDFYTFPATHKLVIAANTRPTVRGTDHGIWRRMRLVPWDVIIPAAERDKTLTEQLVATEAKGILAWLVRGCLEWQELGLGDVSTIDRATDEYRAEQDLLGRWIDERCILEPGAKCDRSAAYHSFRMWSLDEGLDKPWTAATFYGRISEGRRGISQTRDKSGRYLVGIRLRGSVGVETRDPDLSASEPLSS